MVTVGISNNTRLLGIAVIKQDTLLDYSIRLYKSSWSPTKAEMILASLEPCVRQYCIKKVVLSIPHVHHQTESFRTLLYRIREYFKEKGIQVIAETPEAIHPLFKDGQKKTKKELMNNLCLLYPQLSYCRIKELRNKNKYYHKLFEAVAVATMHS